VGFVVDKVATVQVFFEYFGFPCHKPFIPPTSSLQSPNYKRKIEEPPIGEEPHVTLLNEQRALEPANYLKEM
jgi:hypothetical protein